MRRCSSRYRPPGVCSSRCDGPISQVTVSCHRFGPLRRLLNRTSTARFPTIRCSAGSSLRASTLRPVTATNKVSSGARSSRVTNSWPAQAVRRWRCATIRPPVTGTMPVAAIRETMCSNSVDGSTPDAAIAVRASLPAVMRLRISATSVRAASRMRANSPSEYPVREVNVPLPAGVLRWSSTSASRWFASGGSRRSRRSSLSSAVHVATVRGVSTLVRNPSTCATVKSAGEAGLLSRLSRKRSNRATDENTVVAELWVRLSPAGPMRSAKASATGSCQLGIARTSTSNVSVRPSSPWKSTTRDGTEEATDGGR